MKTKKTPKVDQSPEELEKQKAAALDATTSLTIYGTNMFELVMPEELPEADFLAYGARIGTAMKAAAWRIGDYVNFGMTKYGYKDYDKIAAVTNLDEQTLKTYSSVAGRVPAHLREGKSLEVARLMLGRKNEKETVEKLFKRLGTKTAAELREMGSSGGGGGGSDKTESTATEVYEAAHTLVDLIGMLPEAKRVHLKALEKADDPSGGALDALATGLADLDAAFHEMKE